MSSRVDFELSKLRINEGDELCTEPRGRVKNQVVGGEENKRVALL